MVSCVFLPGNEDRGKLTNLIARLELPAPLSHNNLAIQKVNQMPSLFRFLAIIATIVGLVYGSMLALVLTVDPVEREVSVRIPATRINQE